MKPSSVWTVPVLLLFAGLALFAATVGPYSVGDKRYADLGDGAIGRPGSSNNFASGTLYVDGTPLSSVIASNAAATNLALWSGDVPNHIGALSLDNQVTFGGGYSAEAGPYFILRSWDDGSAIGTFGTVSNYMNAPFNAFSFSTANGFYGPHYGNASGLTNLPASGNPALVGSSGGVATNLSCYGTFTLYSNITMNGSLLDSGTYAGLWITNNGAALASPGTALLRVGADVNSLMSGNMVEFVATNNSMIGFTRGGAINLPSDLLGTAYIRCGANSSFYYAANGSPNVFRVGNGLYIYPGTYSTAGLMTNDWFQVRDTNNVPKLMVHSNAVTEFVSNTVFDASVGIGTNNPQASLHVVGVARANGIASYASNKLAVTTITLSSPAGAEHWTNNTGINIFVKFAGGTVTGVGVNDSLWPSVLTGDMIPLQPGEWFSVTNSLLPTAVWKPQ